MKYIIVIFYVCYSAFSVKAQQALTIGDPASSIKLGRMKNYVRDTLYIQDLKNKLVILDFWNTYCPSCIEALPEMEKLQIEFGEKIQIVLVNTSETSNDIINRMKTMSERRKIQFDRLLPQGLLMSNGDTTLQDYFPHKVVPHHVWIGPDGKVIYISSGYNTTSENISRVLRGDNLNVNYKTEQLEKDYFNTQTLRLWVDRDGTCATVQEMSVFLSYNPVLDYLYSYHGINSIPDLKNQVVRSVFLNNTLDLIYTVLYQEKGGGSKFAKKTMNFQQPSRIVRESNHPAWLQRPNSPDAIDEWKKNALFSVEFISKSSEENSSSNLKELDDFIRRTQQIEVKVESRAIESLVISKNQDYFNPRKKLQKDVFLLRESSFSSFLFSLNHSKKLESVFKTYPIIIEFEDEEIINLPSDFISQISSLETLRDFLADYGFEVNKCIEEIDMLVVRDLN